MSSKERLVLLLVMSMLCAAGLAALGSSTAAAQTCVDNPDNSTTCTATTPIALNCPQTLNGTLSVTPGPTVAYLANATLLGHQFHGACTGSTLTENFNPDAPGAPAGYKYAEDDYTFTCTLNPCPAGTVMPSLDVTFTVQSSTSPSSLAPTLPPEDVVVPKTTRVDPKSGKGELPVTAPGWDELERRALRFRDRFCYRPSGTETSYITLNTSRPTFAPFTLNRSCLRRLDAKGTLSVVFDATLHSPAGTLPFTRRVKLVKKK